MSQNGHAMTDATTNVQKTNSMTGASEVNYRDRCENDDEKHGHEEENADENGEDEVPDPDIRVSTITATGGIGSAVDLERLFARLPVRDASAAPHSPFVSIKHSRFGMKESTDDDIMNRKTSRRKKKKMKQLTNGPDTSQRGGVKKSGCEGGGGEKSGEKSGGKGGCEDDQVPVVVMVPKDTFDHQATVVVLVPVTRGGYVHGSSTDAIETVNMKVFQNGNVQMTGLKHVKQGPLVIDALVRTIHHLDGEGGGYDENDKILKRSKPDEDEGASGIRKPPDQQYRVCLINSDFALGFMINREKLYDVLMNDTGVSCCYEPCIYPGVKIQYFWNADADADAARGVGGDVVSGDGTCTCPERCSGKGTGRGRGDCRRITISVFRSGCVIITGARAYRQLNGAFRFTKKYITSRADVVGIE